MTDHSRAAAPRRCPRRPRPTAVAASSLALFLAIFTLLAWQMRAGRDPALGASAQSAHPAAPRAVIVRRVVVTKRHVVIVEDDDAQAGDDGTRQAAAAAPSRAASTSVQNAAPAQAPAAQAPAPQPAPAPAPVVTRTS